MNFKGLSMQSKILLSLVPTFIIVTFVTMFFYKIGTQKNPDLERVIRITELVNQQELMMTRMSDGIRGFLLDPSNKGQYEYKEESDEKFGEITEEIKDITQDNTKLNQQLAEIEKFDEEHLNPAEVKITDFIKSSNLEEAKNSYLTEFMPLKEKQKQNFINMLEEAKKFTTNLGQQITDDQKNNTVLIIIVLWVGLLIGASVTLIITRRITSQSNKIFASINSISQDLSQTAESLSTYATQLSESSTEEASAIQETAASVDEVTQMIKKNSENANRSQSFSKESKDASQEGIQSIQAMITAMTEISQSNDSIMNQVENSTQLPFPSATFLHHNFIRCLPVKTFHRAVINLKLNLPDRFVADVF